MDAARAVQSLPNGALESSAARAREDSPNHRSSGHRLHGGQG